MKKVFRIAFLVAVSFLLHSYSVMPLPGLQSSQRVSFYGTIIYQPSRLHTDGRWIKDAFGNVVRLTGVAWQELAYKNSLSQDPAIRAQRMKELGVSLVRLDSNTLRWNQSRTETGNLHYVSNHKKCVDELAKRGIYVIIDVHSTRLTWEEWLQHLWNDIEFESWRWIPYLADVAYFYRNYTNVLIDVWAEGVWDYGNHTYAEAEAIWDSRVREAVTGIRAVSPDVPVIVSELKVNSIQYFDEHPLPFSNIIYGIQRWYHHDLMTPFWEYAQSYAVGGLETAKQQQKGLYESRLFQMHDLGYPVILKSFGTYIDQSTNQSDPYWREQIVDLYNLFDEYQSSWVQHVWYPDTVYSIINSNWTLNKRGQFWKSNLAT